MTTNNNGYIGFYNGKQCEVYATSSFAAHKLAVAEFQKAAGRRKIKPHLVTVVLAEINGEQVTHTPTN